jgi:hypothetical protein
LAAGFVVGGALQTIAGMVLPASRARDFLTAGVRPTIGPLPIDLILLKFSLGPVGLEVSLLSLLGVLIAYLIARSLF